MTKFDHVEDIRVRSVLMGDVSEDAICYALTQSRGAVASDQFNPDVTTKVLMARELAIEYAEFCWNEQGDLDGTLQYLQDFWSI
jgi:hypothetical protein